MAKFCGKCGSPLDESGACPKCDAQKVIETEKTTAADEVYAQPAYEAAPGVQPIEAPAPAKKGIPKKPIIIAAAAVAVIGVLVFCAFFFHWFGLGKSGGGIATSQQQSFVKTSYGNVYSGLNISEVSEEPANIDDMTITSGDEALKLYSTSVAKDGDTFYGRNGSNRDLVKMTVKGKNSGEIEPWVSEEQLKNSVLGSDGGKRYAYDIGRFFADGDYIYGYVAGSADFMASHYELNYRLFRISKSGDTIEFVGDESVRAYEFVESDGWIYYVDNGYTYEGGKPDYDTSRVGIYKIKTDGSGKTKLSGDFEGEKGSYKDRNYGNAAALTVSGSKLYFLDLTSGESRLARMSLDGSDAEILTPEKAGKYTIDEKNDVIYYIATDYYNVSMDVKKLCKLDLGTKEAEVCENVQVATIFYSMTYDDGYLYFDCDGTVMNGKYKRFNVSSGELQRIKYTDNRKVEYDDFGFEKVIGDGSRTVCWESTGSDKI